jgi:hypothetical protein
MYMLTNEWDVDALYFLFLSLTLEIFKIPLNLNIVLKNLNVESFLISTLVSWNHENQQGLLFL